MNLERIISDHYAVQGGRGFYCYKGCGEFPCNEHQLAAELTAARKVVAAAEMYHDVIIGRDNCPECEWYEGIGMKPCRILETLAEYNEVVK